MSVTPAEPATGAATLPPPLPSDVLAPATAGDGAFLAACRAEPEALVYLLLNVGDGDTQLLLPPPDSDSGRRRALVVDVATTRKLPALLDALHAAGAGPDPAAAGSLPVVVATHPHQDHIGGLPELLRRYGGPQRAIEEFWDPGYFHPSPSFVNLMVQLEQRPWIRRLQPTSGTTLWLDSLRLTVVGPGVGLRSRFDTYGVGVNDASLTLLVDFPAGRILTQPARDDGSARNRRLVRRRTRRLLLGADAQFLSWAQAVVDFPELHPGERGGAGRELRAGHGTDQLRAEVFKLSHHASKHGITLELVERVKPDLALVSSVGGGGKYRFPHVLAVEATREARQPTTTNQPVRRPDHELGIHYTGGTLAGDDGAGLPLGSVGLVVPPSPRRRLRLFRFLDRPDDEIDLRQAREVLPAVR